MGTAFGVKPGRVSWAFDPKATSWDGVTNAPGWWDDSNTHPEARYGDALGDDPLGGRCPHRQSRVEQDLRRLQQAPRQGRVGYKKGEKIVIKMNLNQMHNHGTGTNDSYIAPQLSQALLRQLVQQVGVAPADITIFDAIRNVPSTIYDRGSKEFPGVHFVDGTDTDGARGRGR